MEQTIKHPFESCAFYINLAGNLVIAYGVEGIRYKLYSIKGTFYSLTVDKLLDYEYILPSKYKDYPKVYSLHTQLLKILSEQEQTKIDKTLIYGESSVISIRVMNKENLVRQYGITINQDIKDTEYIYYHQSKTFKELMNFPSIIEDEQQNEELLLIINI